MIGALQWSVPVNALHCSRGLNTFLLQCRLTFLEGPGKSQKLIFLSVLDCYFWAWIVVTKLSSEAHVCLPTQNPWRAAEDATDSSPRERAVKSVSFQESVRVITDRPASMELESQQIQHGCLRSPSNQGQSVVVKVETPDNEVVQVCCFYSIYFVKNIHPQLLHDCWCNVIILKFQSSVVKYLEFLLFI